MRVWVISLFDPTPMDNTRPMRYMSLAKASEDAGHEVHHFAATFRHATKVQRFTHNHIEHIRQNYTVHYIYAPSYNKNISRPRFKSHAKFAHNLQEYIDKAEEPDLVITAYPPIKNALLLSQWCRVRSIPFIMDIIDPWPDVFLKYFPNPIKPLAKIGFIVQYNRLKAILGNTTAVTAISKEYTDWIVRKGFSKENTEHFYPSVPYDEIAKKMASLKLKVGKSNNEVLRLIYAGNLGIAYDLPVILRAAQYFDRYFKGKTEFVICGTGYYEKEIKKQATELRNLRFTGRLEYNDLLKEYKFADVGLAQYKKGATQSVTYKLFDYLASGLPVLNSLQTDMARIIDKNEVGFNNQPGNHEELVGNILNYFNNRSLLERHKVNAVNLTKKAGDNKVVYRKMFEFAAQFVES